MEGPPSAAAWPFELPEKLDAFELLGEQPARVPVGGGSRRWGRLTKKKKADDDDAGYTTVMLLNIPNKYMRNMLIEQLHSSGFRGEIDYMYLPMSLKKRCNLGYCFANFRTSAARQRFSQVFDGNAVQSCLPGFNSSKKCKVFRAACQGREEQVERLGSDTELMSLLAANPKWLPLLIDEAGNVETSHLAQGPGPASGMPERQEGRKSAWAVPQGSEHWGGRCDVADHFPSGREGPGRQRCGGRSSSPHMYHQGGMASYPGAGGGQALCPGAPPMVPGISVATEHGVQCMPSDAAYDVGCIFAKWWVSEGFRQRGGYGGTAPAMSGMPPSSWTSAAYQNKFHADAEPPEDDDSSEAM